MKTADRFYTPSPEMSISSQQTLSTQVGGICWRCVTDYFPFIQNADLPKWLELEKDKNAVCVKKNPLRQVFQTPYRHWQLYVKVFSANQLGEKIKWAFRGWPARREFENLQLARTRGIPAPRPLGWGFCPQAKAPQSVLLTESVGPHISLDDLLWREPPAERKLIDQALIAAAKLIAHLHAAGILLPDLHPGNILLAVDWVEGHDRQVSEVKSAFIVDLQKITICQAKGYASANPDRMWRAKNMAAFYCGIQKRTAIDSQQLFFKEYLSVIDPHAHWCQADIEKYIAKVRVLAEEHRRRIQKSRDRRAVRNSKYAKELKLNSEWFSRVYLRSKRPFAPCPASREVFSEADWRQALSDPVGLMTRGQLIKKGNRAELRDIKLQVGGREIAVVAKFISARTGWRGVLDGFLISRAERNWYMTNMLLNRAIPTAWPLAALHRRKGIWVRESIYIAEKVVDAPSLWHRLKHDEIPPAGRVRDRLADQIGRLLASLRANRLKHRDCKATNILVQKSAAGDEYQAYLIDMDGLSERMFVCEYTPHEAMIRLAKSLGDRGKVSRRDYARVFKGYTRMLGGPLRDRKERRRLFERIQQASRESDVVRKQAKQ